MEILLQGRVGRPKDRELRGWKAWWVVRTRKHIDNIPHVAIIGFSLLYKQQFRMDPFANISMTQRCLHVFVPANNRKNRQKIWWTTTTMTRRETAHCRSGFPKSFCFSNGQPTITNPLTWGFHRCARSRRAHCNWDAFTWHCPACEFLKSNIVNVFNVKVFLIPLVSMGASYILF